MLTQKADIISQLQKDILLLQGFKRLSVDTPLRIDLGPINNAFPNKQFPLAAMHEFISEDAEHEAATKGFVSCLVSGLIKDSGVCVWISNQRSVFPPALKSFGVEPDKVIFVNVQQEREILWVMEEALKCDGLTTVVGEMRELNFTTSRRFQLAVEQSQATGFIIRDRPRNLNINACISRWKISSMPADKENDLPGIGFPRWNIELLKIRNGKPGVWQMEWSLGKFHPIVSFANSNSELRRKTG